MDGGKATSVIWLSSSGFWRLQLSIKRLAKDLLVHRFKVDGLRSFIPWYTNHASLNPILLVLDDLSFESFPELEMKSLVDFLNAFDPKLGRVLVTTRLAPTALLGLGVKASQMRLTQVGAFSNDEARTFLNLRLLSEDSCAKDEMGLILKSLQRSPAALKLAAAFWAYNHSIHGEERRWEDFKDQLSGNTTTNALETALGAAVDQLSIDNGAAYRLLCAISVLSPQGVPLPLLYVSWTNSTPNYTLAVRRSLRRLQCLCLIQCSSDGYQCYMGEVTRTYLYKRLLQSGTLIAYQQEAVDGLDAMFAGVYKSNIWQTSESLIPHIRQILTYEAIGTSFQKSREALLCKLASYLVQMSKWSDALPLQLDAEKICKEVYGPNDLRTMKVAENTAYTLYMMNKLDEAAAYHKRIDGIYAEIFPEKHWQRLLHSGQYGAVLVDQSKWQEAEKQLLLGIEGAEQLYGVENHHGIAARTSLVRLYGMMGQYEKAREQCERNLTLYLRDLPSTHQAVFRTMSSLGVALKFLGRYEEAIATQNEAVRLAELSEDTTAEALFEVRTQFSITLSLAGDIAAAAEEQERLVALCPQLEPKPGENTLTALVNLGVTLDRLSRYGEAQVHLERALTLCADAKPNDPTLLRVRNNLALVYLRQGHFERAEVEYRSLVKMQMEIHPIDRTQATCAAHPDVLLMQNNLGGALMKQRRYPEAIELQREVLAGALAQPSGSENRSTMFGRTNLAESLRLWAEEGGPDGTSLLEEAETLHRLALDQRERQLGEMWQTWVSRVNVGMVLQAQGKVGEVKEWYTDLERLAKAVGEGNATVMMGKEKLAKLEISSNLSQMSLQPST